MAQYSFSLLFTLGALVTFTLGATVNPMMGFMNNPDAFSVEKQCPMMCSSGCAVMQMTCIDIPNLVDCSAMQATCAGQCKQLCGCVSDCSTDCKANNACTDQGDSVAEITCYSQRLMCSGVCQLNCPGVLMVQGLNSVIQMVLGQAAQLMLPPAV